MNAYTTAYQQAPAIAMASDGRMVVAWESWEQDGNLAGVFGRRYEADGTPGPEFQVNTYTTGMQDDPAVSMNASGSFIVAWAGIAGTDVRAIRARRYDASGVAGPEFTVASHPTIEMRPPDVALDDDGSAVFAWSTDFGEIYASRYDAAGAIDLPPFQVNTYITGTQIAPRVALDAHGGFLVVWTSARPAPDSSGVSGRRYDALGQPAGGEFIVNSYTTGVQNNPALARAPNGNFLAAWADAGRDGSGHGVYARPFDRVGAPSDNDFRVNVHTADAQWMAAVAPIGDRRFVVTWASNNQDGSSQGVYARIFETDLIFRDGFESGDMSEWSSSQTDDGDLDVTALAALNTSTAGLQGSVDDTAGLYVQDDSPDDEGVYRARFYFDTADFDPGESLNRRRTRLFLAFEEAPTRRVMAIVLRRLNGDYSLMGRARLDDNSQHDTGFKPISPGTHFVEVHWRRASGPDANDGTLEMWIDGPVRVHVLEPRQQPQRDRFRAPGRAQREGGSERHARPGTSSSRAGTTTSVPDDAQASVPAFPPGGRAQGFGSVCTWTETLDQRVACLDAEALRRQPEPDRALVHLDRLAAGGREGSRSGRWSPEGLTLMPFAASSLRRARPLSGSISVPHFPKVSWERSAASTTPHEPAVRSSLSWI